MTYTMTLSRQVTIHYAVEVEADSLAEAVTVAHGLDTTRLDEAEREVVLSTSDHDSFGPIEVCMTPAGGEA
jgi:hypothetical protein